MQYPQVTRSSSGYRDLNKESTRRDHLSSTGDDSSPTKTGRLPVRSWNIRKNDDELSNSTPVKPSGLSSFLNSNQPVGGGIGKISKGASTVTGAGGASTKTQSPDFCRRSSLGSSSVVGGAGGGGEIYQTRDGTKVRRVARLPNVDLTASEKAYESRSQSKLKTRSNSNASSTSIKISNGSASKKTTTVPAVMTKQQPKKSKPLFKPPNTAKTQKAAKTIQRFLRGWWARLHFQVPLLEYKLTHKTELDRQALKRMQLDIEAKKLAERRAIEEAHQRALEEEERFSQESKTVLEGKQLIDYLRRENKKIRDKNDQIAKACRNLLAHNAKLEGCSTQSDGYMGMLEQFSKQIEETHAKLLVVEPKYAASVQKLVDAVEKHALYCASEHTIKLLYANLVQAVETRLLERKQKPELVITVGKLVEEARAADNLLPLPQEVPLEGHIHEAHKGLFAGDAAAAAATGGDRNQNKIQDDHDDDDSDSENYDMYSVAMYDS